MDKIARVTIQILNRYSIIEAHMTRKSTFKNFLWSLVVIITAGLVMALFALVVFEASLPNVETLKDVHLQEPLRVFTRDNKLIAEFGTIRRAPIALDDVPKQLIAATLATEDQRFYSHPGVDWLGLGRAGISLLLTREKKEGGSTITMQVARNFFLTNKKTYNRKIKEILLALKIDHEFSKDKILELYFNKIFYGSRAYGIEAASQVYYGKKPSELTLSEMAMLAGLPKAPSSLNPIYHPQAALDRRNHVLTRMLDLHYIDTATYNQAIGAPLTAKLHELQVSVSAPYVAEMVRQLMLKQFDQKTYGEGYDVYTTIDSQLQQNANAAVMKGLLAYDKRHGYRGPIQHLNDTGQLDNASKILSQIPTLNGLRPALILKIGNQSADALLKTGDTVTIPWSGLSWARRQTMKGTQEFLSAPPQKTSDILKIGDIVYLSPTSDNSWILNQLPAAEAATITINPHDGSMLALIGGFNYFNSKFNRATQAERQPGSSFKPFIYSAALEKGFTLATIVNDAPIAIEDNGSADTLWRPENDTENFSGPIRTRIALINSRNLASIRVLQLIGIPYAIDYATRFGFQKEQLPESLSLALGTTNVTLLQMAEAYAVFANGGYRINTYFIDHIVNSKDKIIYKTAPIVAGDPIATDDHTKNIAPRVITPQNAYLITSALRDVIQHGTGRGARVLQRTDLAGKTGTTNDKRDAWFCGFNSNMVSIVWIGFDQQRSLHEYASKAALPLWVDFMAPSLKDAPYATMPQPDGIVTVRIDSKSGLLAPPNDPNAIFEKFRTEDIPTEKDTGLTATAPGSADDTPADMNDLY